MKLFTFLTAITAVSAGSIRFPQLRRQDATSSSATSLSAANHYGSPIPAWEAGYSPAWYLGDNPGSAPGLPWLKDRTLCAVINKVPESLHCPTLPLTLSVRAFVNARARAAVVKRDDPVDTAPPTGTVLTTGPSQAPPPPPPPGVYYPVFSGLDGAIHADDFLTFGLVDTVHDCQLMCDSVPECGFFNTYHDVNGKDGSPLLTCSLYSACHGADQATNKGGQTQPDGSIDFITDSDGYCKQ